MDIRTLFPKLEHEQKRNRFNPKVISHQHTVKARIKERIYIESKQFVQRTSVIQQDEINQQIQLKGMERDVFHSIAQGKNIELATESIKQMISIIKLSLNTLTNNFKYLQIIILTQPDFLMENLAEFPKDDRWVCTTFQKLKNYSLRSISQIIVVNVNQATATSLFKMRAEHYFSVLSLTQKKSMLLFSYFEVRMYKMEEKHIQQFLKNIEINNEILILNELSIRFMIYLAVIKGIIDSKKGIFVITNQSRLQSVTQFIDTNFLDVKVSSLNDFNVKSENKEENLIIFIELDKPAFFKSTKNFIFIRLNQQKQQSNKINQSWTTFKSGVSINEIFDDYQEAHFNIPNFQLAFPHMKLITMDFTLAGSFIRFHLNLDDTFIPQDFMVMHSKYYHKNVQTLLKKQSEKTINFLLPQEKLIKMLAIINAKFTDSLFDKLVTQITKYRCNTVVFRESEYLDCFEILKCISESKIFNDIMNHFTVAFQFTSKKRYQRFMIGYMKNIKQ